jgi:membrane associated rhomboid family serine protease
MDTPVITYAIIAFTALTSFIAFSNADTVNKLIFYPYEIKEKKEWFRFISHGLIHADFTHLLFNMLTLYFFGQFAEMIFDRTMYLVFYITALVVASIPDYLKEKDNPNYRSLGASGAVAAVLAATVILSPWATIYIKFIIPIPAILYLVLYIGYSVYMAKKGGDNIGHSAHLWGTIYGVVFMLIFKTELFKRFIEQLQNPHFG